MNVVFRNIWRMFQKRKLKKNSVLIKGNVRFNQNTKFFGNNKIGNNSSVVNSEIGRFSYMGKRNDMDNVVIGKFCSMSSDIRIISSTHPSSGFVSTHPAFYSTLRQAVNTFSSEDVFEEHITNNGRRLTIGNDVWVGQGVSFTGGIKVGNGAIIGAKALVTKDVPPYAIVGGIPAKIIRYRFTEDQIAFLESFRWWDKDDDWLKEHIDQMRSIDLFMHDFNRL